MGAKTKEVGGGPAVGLGQDIINFLQQGLSTGTFGGGASAAAFNGANPMTSTQGIAGFLNDILSGGAGNVGGSMQSMIQKDADRNAQAMRARYSMGGTGFGTPAAYGEAMLRSETGPKMATAVGGLQLQTVLPLLQMIMQMGSKGITQRQTVAEPNPWMQGLGMLMQGAGAALPMFAGMPGGGMPPVPNAPPANFWNFNNLPGIS